MKSTPGVLIGEDETTLAAGVSCLVQLTPAALITGVWMGPVPARVLRCTSVRAKERLLADNHGPFLASADMTRAPGMSRVASPKGTAEQLENIRRLRAQQ